VNRVRILARRCRGTPPLLPIALAQAVALTFFLHAGATLAASPLLESVKQNPQLAKSLCNELRQLNSQGVRSTSPQAIDMVAKRQNISPADAEIVTTYVVGLHCPDVR
jgi:hypothetical protein